MREINEWVEKMFALCNQQLRLTASVISVLFADGTLKEINSNAESMLKESIPGLRDKMMAENKYHLDEDILIKYLERVLGKPSVLSDLKANIRNMLPRARAMRPNLQSIAESMASGR
jgi:hypothetical protein